MTAESQGELIIYSTDDGLAQIQLRAVDGTVWLTQAEIAALFDTTLQNVNLHLKNVFQDNELDQSSVLKDSLITASDGKAYRTKLYNLDAILAVGYRVRSPRGTQFRTVYGDGELDEAATRKDSLQVQTEGERTGNVIAPAPASSWPGLTRPPSARTSVRARDLAQSSMKLRVSMSLTAARPLGGRVKPGHDD